MGQVFQGAKRLTRKWALWLVCAACLCIMAPHRADAQQTDGLALLAPVDTSSPRSTLEGFIASGGTLADLVNARANQGTDALATDADNQQLAADVSDQAATAMDLASVPPLIMQRSKIERVLMLYEVLRRVDRQVLDQAPADGHAASWLVPGTPIRIARISDGDHKGEYIFADDTIENLASIYDRAALRHEAWGNGGDSYAIFSENLGQIAPTPLKGAVLRLPAALLVQQGGNAIWQWLSITVIVSLGVLATVLSFLGMRRITTANPFGKLLIAGVPILMARVAAFLSLRSINALHLSEETYWLSSAVLLTIAYMAWVSWMVVCTIWLSKHAPRYFYPDESTKAAVMRLSLRFIGVVLTGVVIARGLELVGVPLLGVLAGLGVGGLALALAAQPTAENLIAGIILFVDQPARVGDECEFDGFRGVVEEIGIRSTSIRLHDGSLMTLTNSEFSNMKVRNLGVGRYNFCFEFPLVPGTRAESLRVFLDDVERYMAEAETILKDRMYVGIDCINASGVNVKISGEFVESAGEPVALWNGVQLAILEIIQNNGIEIASAAN